MSAAVGISSLQDVYLDDTLLIRGPRDNPYGYRKDEGLTPTCVLCPGNLVKDLTLWGASIQEILCIHVSFWPSATWESGFGGKNAEKDFYGSYLEINKQNKIAKETTQC